MSSFEERLHPRANDGTFAGRGELRTEIAKVRVTSRRRGGPQVDEAVPLPGREPTPGPGRQADDAPLEHATPARTAAGGAPKQPATGGGPRDATQEQLQTALAEGRKVQLHRYDLDSKSWQADGPPVTAETAVARARAAIDAKQTVRLEVTRQHRSESVRPARRPASGR